MTDRNSSKPRPTPINRDELRQTVLGTSLGKQAMRAPHRATADVVAMAGQPVAKRLYAAAQQYNAEFFAGRLAPALVLITATQSARTLGDYSPRDVHGLESRIRIAPAVVEKGEAFMLDVLLHEMIHAWCEEVEGTSEPGYRGHGPAFAAACNMVGAKLGLPEVGVKGRDGKPPCNQWPLNVRPDGYYQVPYKAPTRSPKPAAPKAPKAPRAPRQDRDEAEGGLAAALEVLPSLTSDELLGLAHAIRAELERRVRHEASAAGAA